MGSPPKFNDNHKNFIYKESEGKLTVVNKAFCRNISAKFQKTFNESINYSYVNKLPLKKFGQPYRGIHSILLTEDHIEQRLEFIDEIISKKIKQSDIMTTDECRIILYSKANSKINVI